MKSLILIAVLGLVSAQQQPPQYAPQGYRGPPAGAYRQQAPQPQPRYNAYTTTTEAPRIYHPPASVHYVNIGQKLDGDYKFGYDTGKGPAGQSFREEVRLPDGTVKGAYGYLDAQGKMRIVKYTAGKAGYVVEGDEASTTAAKAVGGSQAPQPAPQQQYRPQPAPQQYRPAPAPAQAQRPPVYQAQPRPNPAQYIPQNARPVPARPTNPYVPRPNGQPAALPVQTGNPYGLPGVSLVAVQPTGPRPTRNPYASDKEKQEEDYYGPAVINAALLGYNIGAQPARQG